ncbi:MAG: orotidine 5'-phosphate decarboxylase [Candidatus Berkelbacteria bacterium]|nr:orotidine 5'-phosphate decarboxylase [Candidatus Berkelbacteria bacterium]
MDRDAMVKTLPLLFVALDDSSLPKVMERASTVTQVTGNYGFKVNLDAMLGVGVENALNAVAQFGKPIFADFKMYNGARTMSEMVQAAARSGAVLTNVFAGNAPNLLRKVAIAASGDEEHKVPPILVYGIGPLTHLTDEDCQCIYGCNFEAATVRLGEITVKAGLDGYIGPGRMNRALNILQLPLLNPAVRPDWYEDPKANDQEQTVTPTQAIVVAEKKVVLVCGSPIFKSPDPEAALKRILDEIARAA